MFSLQFSPTGQAWAAATTEGLLVYSQYAGLVFDPWDLQMGVTPAAVRSALSEENYTDGKYIFYTSFFTSLHYILLCNFPDLF